MTRMAVLRFQFSLVCCIGLLPLGAASGQILIDDFETGTPDTNIPNTGPWRVNDSGKPAQYRSANNPFPTGDVYAYLNDDVAAAGAAVRFMSTNATDAGGLGPQIAAKVTTLSFDFLEGALDVDAPGQPGLGVGYYSPGVTGTGIDLNAAGRTFRAFLHNGLLSPDALSAGTAVAYDREKVHTVFMLANDTAAAVENYRDGQTLDPAEADVWISLDGAAPTYAFSVLKQNPTLGPWGIGFRTFTLDIEEIFLDNVLLVEGASFDRSAFDAPEGLPGDYNGDDVVDGADFLEWQRQFGDDVEENEGADGSGNGLIDDADLDIWASHFGEPGGVAAAVSAPEPCLVALLLPIACFVRRGRANR